MEKILLMEFNNIKADIRPDLPYDVLLQECNTAKKEALLKGDINAAGYSSKGAAECYRRLGQNDKALQEYNSAIVYFQETKNINGISWTNWAISNILRQQCNYINSTNLLKKVYINSLNFKDFRCAAYSLAGIAENTRILGNYFESFLQHRNALKIFNNLRDYRGIVWAYEGIAQMYKNCGEFKKGQRLFENSIRIAKDIKDIRGLGYALKGMGEILGITVSYKEGTNHLEMAIAIFKEINFKVGIAYSYKTIGDINLKYSNFEKAKNCYDEALKLFKELQDQRGIAYVTQAIGAFYKKQGILNLAKGYLENSQMFFREKKIGYGLFLSSK